MELVSESPSTFKPQCLYAIDTVPNAILPASDTDAVEVLPQSIMINLLETSHVKPVVYFDQGSRIRVR